MSKLKGVMDSFSGGKQAAKAATQAAGIQARSADEAIKLQRESRDIAREDLQPFRQTGQEALSGLSGLVTDPSQQLSFIQDNPFFEALAGRATETLLANQAAKGKLGSGGTAEALQNSLLLLGTDLLSQNIGQRQNLANLGLGAATGQAGVTQQTGQNIANLTTQKGNVQAAGIIGARNAINQGRQQSLQLAMQGAAAFGGGGAGGAGAGAGSSFAACDIRFKENIKRIGLADNGLPLYMFNYKGDSTPHINVMAQDVEKIKPEAVVEINNYKFVNANKLWH